MTRHRVPFHKTDIKRAYHAAVAAGVPNPRVIIDVTTGSITITAGPAPIESADVKNEWDETSSPPAPNRKRAAGRKSAPR